MRYIIHYQLLLLWSFVLTHDGLFDRTGQDLMVARFLKIPKSISLVLAAIHFCPIKNFQPSLIVTSDGDTYENKECCDAFWFNRLFLMLLEVLCKDKHTSLLCQFQWWIKKQFKKSKQRLSIEGNHNAQSDIPKSWLKTKPPKICWVRKKDFFN